MTDPMSSIQILPPAITGAIIIFWLLLRYRKQLKAFFGDLQCLYSGVQAKWQIVNTNRSLKRTFKKCEKEPVFRGVEDGLVILSMEEDRKSRGTLTLRGKNMAVAKIPQLNVENVVQSTQKHIQQNVMPLFFIEDLEKLRKSMELVFLKLLFDQLGLDGAYKVAVHKVLKEEFKKPHIERLFNAIIRVNEELKPKPWVDRRILKMILLETCKMEL